MDFRVKDGEMLFLVFSQTCITLYDLYICIDLNKKVWMTLICKKIKDNKMPDVVTSLVLKLDNHADEFDKCWHSMSFVSYEFRLCVAID